MWLPTPVYERVPHFYFLAGLLLIADGLYLGFEYRFSFAYIGVGLASCAYGVGIRLMRIRYRRNAANGQQSAAEVTDQSSAPAIEESAPQPIDELNQGPQVLH